MQTKYVADAVDIQAAHNRVHAHLDNADVLMRYRQEIRWILRYGVVWDIKYNSIKHSFPPPRSPCEDAPGS